MAATAKVRQMARECLAARVRIINRLVTQACDEGLRPFKIRIALVNILVAVAATGPVSPAALARTLALDKSTLSRDVAKLQGKGWLEAVPASEGRGQLLRTTDAGVALLEKLHPAWAAAQKRLAEQL